LARGDAESAAGQLRRALAETGPALERARLLPAAVEIALARGDLTAARAASEELQTIADEYGSAMLRAIAASAAGQVSLAEGDIGESTALLRESVRLWVEIEAPYEAARARELLGAAYRADSDDEGAVLEIEAARAAFDRLGAAIDLRRASDALGRKVGTRRVTRTFMFTDIVGSTDLIGVVGDDAWGDLRRWHDHALRAAFAAHDGEEVDHAGDGFFVAFPDASNALECAVGIQRLLAEHRHTHGFAPRVRIGLHADAATSDGAGYQGLGVHAAARIAALADAEQVLATAETCAAAAGRWQTSAPSDVQLKGIPGRVQVVSVDWR
jgi:class 3 adenylate cyclase